MIFDIFLVMVACLVSTSSWEKITKCETTEYTSPTLQSETRQLHMVHVGKVNSYTKERHLHLHPRSNLTVWPLYSPLSSCTQQNIWYHNYTTYQQEAKSFNSNIPRPLIDNHTSNNHLSLCTNIWRIIWFKVHQSQWRTSWGLYCSLIWYQRFNL